MQSKSVDTPCLPALHSIINEWFLIVNVQNLHSVPLLYSATRDTLVCLGQGGYSPILEGSMEHLCDQPSLRHFPLGSYFMSKLIPHSAHLVPKIIWPKVGLIFRRNLSFNKYCHILCCNYIFDFRSTIDLIDSIFIIAQWTPY